MNQAPEWQVLYYIFLSGPIFLLHLVEGASEQKRRSAVLEKKGKEAVYG